MRGMNGMRGMRGMFCAKLVCLGMLFKHTTIALLKPHFQLKNPPGMQSMQVCTPPPSPSRIHLSFISCSLKSTLMYKVQAVCMV